MINLGMLHSARNSPRSSLKRVDFESFESQQTAYAKEIGYLKGTMN
jgi:hypothetical protein